MGFTVTIRTLLPPKKRMIPSVARNIILVCSVYLKYFFLHTNTALYIFIHHQNTVTVAAAVVYFSLCMPLVLNNISYNVCHIDAFPWCDRQVSSLRCSLKTVSHSKFHIYSQFSLDTIIPYNYLFYLFI